jgi:hypothetical protein
MFDSDMELDALPFAFSIALCVGHNIPIMHDTSKIMSHIKSNNLLRQSDFDRLAKSVQTVTMSGNYNDIRFPGNNPAFWDNMLPDQIRIRAKAANEVYELCWQNLTTSGVL